MSKPYYAISTLNPKTKTWEDETTASTLLNAKKAAIDFSRTRRKKVRIVKEQIFGVYEDGKQINK
jgi:hypothetical protein